MLPTIQQLATSIRTFQDPAYSGFSSFPTLASSASAQWANVADRLFRDVVPASTTYTAARTAFIAQMQGLTYSSDGILLLRLAFNAYATVLAQGMQPAFTATPPPLPPLFSFTGLVTKSAKTEAYNAAAILIQWAKTGTAIPNSGGAQINWS